MCSKYDVNCQTLIATEQYNQGAWRGGDSKGKGCNQVLLYSQSELTALCGPTAQVHKEGWMMGGHETPFCWVSLASSVL
jgi:hypothetical protein